MTPVYRDDWLTIYGGDCRAVLATLPDESVHCVVTSPPYWGLRDYGTASWSGGDEDHAHVGSVMRTMPAGSEKQASNKGAVAVAVASGDCACGATRVDNQLGLEPTPEEYVANLVAVFREVRRVLRSDGTLWLNLGDSYASQGGPEPAQTKWQVAGASDGQNGGRSRAPGGLKPKDLVGIPWRVAFALQADGWYLRSDIIWSKPNPMPESVTDRPTKSHEYLFLLAKSQRYYFDGRAVAEPVTESTVARLAQATLDAQEGSSRANGGAKTNGRMKAVGPRFGGSKYGDDSSEQTRTKSGNEYVGGPYRNIRSVWTIATQPYSGAHFAVFPPKLVEPCILAGAPGGGRRPRPFRGQWHGRHGCPRTVETRRAD